MRAIGIHLGLNAVDPAHYMGWTGELTACENDANDMANIARSNMFETTILLSREATSNRLLQMLAGEAARMISGDMLILTIAGHGTQIVDVNGDEPERRDEAWVLYDRMLIDDEIYTALAQFNSGVKILTITDICHSETSVRLRLAWERLRYRPRELPYTQASRIVSKQSARYTRALSASQQRSRSDLRSTTLLMSACKDEQLALDGDRNGQFTGTLRNVWADGHFNGDYISLVKKIREYMPPSQTPGLLGLGPSVKEFAARRPFSRG
ncbi:hypothetical protein SAE02_76170 [Skermanella aerolata]|uniref:Peptidase C14 caspase domain-containing protein n=1 Tax=Skermanella aerolata TaxID=393310 RepID=A0A512E458_9PROT|nr:caspase family protein [Skermanella aerolata]GEO43469.1 hypothetical protein SAE02_76170 [Skermanella aerolata]